MADWKTALGGNTERTLTAAAGPSPRDPYRHALAMRLPQKDRPRAKAVVELQGCRSRRSWGASTKKRVDLGSLCHIEHETAPPFVDAPQQRAFPKIRCDVTDRKASPDAPDLFFWDFVLVESTRTQPEANDRHRQSPLLAHSNTPKNRRFSAGGAVHRPFSSGSVKGPAF